MPHQSLEGAELSARVGFSQNPLLRHSEKRDDEAEIARFMRDPRVTVLITNRPDIALRFRKA